MTKYWIAVASRNHVLRGVTGGFAQVCHGKAAPLRRTQPGDFIIYYSPVEEFGSSIPYRRFTALGKIKDKEPYLFEMSPDFIPWRIDVSFFKVREIEVMPLVDQLSFIKDKRHWGLPFRYGFLSIPMEDFRMIASHMELKL